jgi:L-fuconolactonase
VIIDSHCHAWARWPYDPPVPDPDSRGRAEQLLWEMDQSGVSQAVVICAGLRDNIDNNHYAAAAVRASGGRLTAFADVDSRWSETHHQPGAPARFRAVLDQFAPLGVTHYLNEAEDAGWLLGEEGEACLRLLADHGVILSLACGAQQVPTIAKAAARHPDLTILLHHLGRPRAGDASALAAILTAAPMTNVYIKVSGFAYGVSDGWNFPYPAMQQVLRPLRDGYGPDRLCWGSDYPVARRFMTYRQSLEIVRSHCEFLTAGERELILGRTMGGLLERAAAKRRTP